MPPRKRETDSLRKRKKSFGKELNSDLKHSQAFPEWRREEMEFQKERLDGQSYGSSENNERFTLILEGNGTGRQG